jgi:hypothetical protein
MVERAHATADATASVFAPDGSSRERSVIEAGAVGGLVGGVCIWIYEAIVWVWAEQQMPLYGIPGNATGLVFGKATQQALGLFSYVLGTAIHFFFCVFWGILFAALWPRFRDRQYEATLVALFFAAVVWVVMHIAIVLVSSNHPNYLDPNVIVGGLMSHIFFAVPLALVVKRRLEL